MLSRFATYLDEIAKTGSVRKAAGRLNVSASAIDRQLLNAEEALGVILFERLPRGMRLTAAGELIVHRLRSWRRDMSTIRVEIEELKGMMRGEVRIAAAPETVAGFLPSAIAAFRQSHPRIGCHIEVIDSDRIRQRVIDGQADLGLTFSPPPMPGVEVVKACTFVPVALMAAADAPSRIALDDFFARPLILPDSSMQLRDTADLLRSRLRSDSRPAMTVNSPDLAMELVRTGAGITLIVLPKVPAMMPPPGLGWVPFGHTRLPQLHLSLIVPIDRSLSVAAMTARGTIETALAACD